MQSLMQQAVPLATQFHILDSLHFKQILTRHETIKDTYADTFSWIFDDDTTSFQSWLEHESGIFWVRGKAGSGKSTLMKFLSDHERTPETLRRWAGAKKLVTASFYFWNAGTPMEKSQEGLLQSLLFQILKQCPELIPIVTPDRWRGDNAFHRYRKPWGRKELSDALVAALSSGTLPARFCFFIDGLDEFAGDYAELLRAEQNTTTPQPDHHAFINDLKALLRTDDVKICVSSRPWNPFRNPFGGDEDRMLILEDLTKEDMRVYIKGMLEEDGRFSTLARQDPQASELVSEIREKAQGVFLWVFLAVRSLLRGLSEDDSVAKLHQRLRSLPSDLKQFFSRILTSIDEGYRPLTCRMLVMTQYANSELPLLAFWFLKMELDNPDYALQAKREPLGSAAGRLMSSAVSSVNKWCRDLLEIKILRVKSGEAMLLFHSSIGFLHRTVRDLLSDREVSSYLFSHVGPGFDPDVSFMRLYLAQSKLLPAWDLKSDRQEAMRDSFSFYAQVIMNSAKKYELKQGTPATALLEELDVVGQHPFREGTDHWTDHMPRQRTSSTAEQLQIHDHGKSNFLAFAVTSDLQCFVREQFRLHPMSIRKTGRPLLGYALYPTIRALELNFLEPHVSAGMFEVLLSAGADPKEAALLSGRMTLWQALLYDCYKGRQGDMRSAVRAFLAHGADLRCKVPVALTKSAYAPIGNLSGSRHTRVDPSRGELVSKEFATVEECLLKVFDRSELDNVLASWRPPAASLAAGKARDAAQGWVSWMFSWQGR